MMNHARLPCYLPYTQLVWYVYSQDIGELSDIPVVDGCRPVTGVRRSLRATEMVMADVFRQTGGCGALWRGLARTVSVTPLVETVHHMERLMRT